MKKYSRKQRKVLIMFILISLTAVTFVVETYAWFVGLTSAETNNITIAISAKDGLELSLNGQYWTSGSTPLKIKDANHTYITETGCSNANCAYSTHANSWTTSLNPVSSPGWFGLDSTSRLYMYKKSSLSANPGGYYIKSIQIDNTVDEVDGYIAFDLFIRNGKKSAYNGAYNMAGEEDIYLSADSYATTNIAGTEPNYGAANSLRVGFFEMGRVGSSGYDVSTLTGIDCSSSTTGVTPLCVSSSGMNTPGSNPRAYTQDELQGYTWNIWEPNHASHSTQLVSYFNGTCKKRTGNDSYGGACQPIDTWTSKKTYSSIDLSECYQDNGYKLNIYDGKDLNEHTGEVQIANNTYTICAYETKTYKTSDATTVGKDKPSLIKLGGNSITKVRVYVWLEGQDIDNYDLISKNPSLTVKFGFTKDRYEQEPTNTTATSSRTPSTFQDDSWAKIQYNVQNNNTSQYNVGDMRTVRIDGKEYRLRLANKISTDGVCYSTVNSQTACGFVVEFVDAVTTMKMRDTSTNAGGYPATKVYTYLNGTLWDKLPEDLRGVISDTRVVSGHGSSDSSNFTSTGQKLFLLSGKEIYGSDSYDTAASNTRQLDYYSGKGVTTSANYLYARKQYDGSYDFWWLRPAHSNYYNYFRIVNANGDWSNNVANRTSGVSPAFRIA